MYVNILCRRVSSKLGYTVARTWSFNSMTMSSSVHQVSTRMTVTSRDCTADLCQMQPTVARYTALSHPCCVLSGQVLMEPAVSQALSWAVESWKYIPEPLWPPESTL